MQATHDSTQVALDGQLSPITRYASPQLTKLGRGAHRRNTRAYILFCAMHPAAAQLAERNSQRREKSGAAGRLRYARIGRPA